jgi:two-component system chemotaxis response regulator CheV
MISDRLNAAGFEINSFNNGSDAWEHLKSISARVAAGEKLSDICNVVITDIEMPMMDGYSLTKNIKDDPYLKSLPVIIFSSIISEEVLHKGHSVGANAQLTKPQIGELLETIRLLLEPTN